MQFFALGFEFWAEGVKEAVKDLLIDKDPKHITIIVQWEHSLHQLRKKPKNFLFLRWILNIKKWMVLPPRHRNIRAKSPQWRWNLDNTRFLDFAKKTLEAHFWPFWSWGHMDCTVFRGKFVSSPKNRSKSPKNHKSNITLIIGVSYHDGYFWNKFFTF